MYLAQNITKYLILVTILTLFNGKVSAIDDVSYFTNQVNQLEKSKVHELDATLPQSQTLLKQAVEMDDKEIIIRIVLFQAESLKELEKYYEAKAVIYEYEPLISEYGNLTHAVRANLVKLSVADAEVNKQKSSELRDELLVDVALLEDKDIAAEAYAGVGYSIYLYNKGTKGIDYYKKAYELFSQTGNEEGIAQVYNLTANLYGEQGDSDLALSYFHKAIDIYNKYDSKHAASLVHYNMGITYSQKEAYEDAKKQFLESINISLELDDQLNLAYSKYSLGGIFNKEEEFAESVPLFLSAIETFKSNKDERMVYSGRVGLLESYVGLKYIDKAKRLFEVVDESAKRFNDTDYPTRYWQIKAKFYALIEEYEQAYHTQKSFSELQRKHYKRVQLQGIEKLMVEFDSKVKDAENQVLIKDNELKALSLEQQNNRLFFLIIIAFMAVGIISVIGFLLYRQTQHRSRFQKMALQDYLTKAPNRRAILKYAKEKFEDAQSLSVGLTVAIVDLDYFKKFNDNFGHDIGDEVLKGFSDSCAKALRKQDRYGRYGGEEWLLVLNDIDNNQIDAIFKRLKSKLREVNIEGVPDNTGLTFSMGVASYDKQIDKSIQDLINRADVNLYKAKESGRDRFVI